MYCYTPQWPVGKLPSSNQLGQIFLQVYWGKMLLLQSVWFMNHTGGKQFGFLKQFVLNKNYIRDKVIREVSVLADVLRKSFSEKSISKAINLHKNCSRITQVHSLWILYVIFIHILECVYAYFKTKESTTSGSPGTEHERMHRANRCSMSKIVFILVFFYILYC